MDEQSTKILLIEDNPGDARLIELMLEDARGFPFAIQFADRLSEGLDILGTDAVDVVILDLTLPDSAGLETFTRLHDHAVQIPIIVLTGFADEELAVTAVREGAQDYLVKGELDGNLLARACRYAMERHKADQALRESEERYALATEGANDGIWDWDLKSNRIYFSPRWVTMLQLPPENITNNLEDWFSRVHPEDLEQVKIDIQAHLEGLSMHFENEHRMLHQDGTYRWMLCRGLAVRDQASQAYRMAGSFSDITDRKRAEEQLQRDAFYDGLTHLPNRAVFMDRLGRAVERAKRRQDNRFAILFLDLDRFKMVNDGMGHGVGDDLLVSLANRLDECVRSADTVARLSADEFAFLIEDLEVQNEAIKIANRIKADLSKPFLLSNREVVISASVGITVSDLGYERAEDALRDAKIAMNHAKADGGGDYVVFEVPMRSRAVNLLQLEAELRRAIEQEEFQLYYQPIISLTDGKISGAEALIRWIHPQHGVVSPGEFIPLAEDTGLIVPIGDWVLVQACRQFVDWQSKFSHKPPLSISVNLSTKQFRQSDLVDKIVDVLNGSGIDPANLRLEITESVLMDTNDSALSMLTTLHESGVHVHIDDFGTGYSSLSYLHQLPIDALKIDRSFVARIDDDQNNTKIIQTIISLANDLDLIAIAEGVETKSQLVALRSLQCEYAQGYLFAKPVTSDDFELIFTGKKRIGWLTQPLFERV
jgi:diguanylate cyclase (GGDEF)-like protein/PAS domain S-box-containing protein